MEYWNPEQPPPTTPIRSPAGSGSWVAMISRTLAAAWGVSTSGAFLTISSCCGAVVVAMFFSVLKVHWFLDVTLLVSRVAVQCRISLHWMHPPRKGRTHSGAEGDALRSEILFESGKNPVCFIKMTCD